MEIKKQECLNIEEVFILFFRKSSILLNEFIYS